MKAVVTPVIGRVETAAETFLMETDVRENPSQRANCLHPQFTAATAATASCSVEVQLEPVSWRGV